MSIRSVCIKLDQSLDYRDADAIKCHHQALHSGVKWFEEVAPQEAQARGWDLTLIKDLIQEMDDSTWGETQTECSKRGIRGQHIMLLA
jgi:hypothetical protein